MTVILDAANAAVSSLNGSRYSRLASPALTDLFNDGGGNYDDKDQDRESKSDQFAKPEHDEADDVWALATRKRVVPVRQHQANKYQHGKYYRDQAIRSGALLRFGLIFH